MTDVLNRASVFFMSKKYNVVRLLSIGLETIAKTLRNMLSWNGKISRGLFSRRG